MFYSLIKPLATINYPLLKHNLRQLKAFTPVMYLLNLESIVRTKKTQVLPEITQTKIEYERHGGSIP